MAVSGLIARGIGFSPGSVKFIPTAGFIAGEVVVFIRGSQIGTMMYRHFDIVRGWSLTFNGVVREADGTAIDISDDVLVWKIGTSDFRKTLLTLTEGDGIEVTDAANGKYTVTLEGAKLASVDAGHYRHQGEGQYGTLPYGFVAGKFRLRKDMP